MKKVISEEQRKIVKIAVKKANTGKVNNPLGKDAKVKLDMSFEEAVKRGVNVKK